MFGDLRHSDINKVQIMMRASRLHHSKPFYRVIIPTNDFDMESNDIKEIVETFCKIDTKMKECIEKKSKTRIRIDGLDVEDIEKAELQYEQIYDRFGEFISGKSNEELWLLKYEMLKKFISLNNKLPTLFDLYNNIKIGSWCITQRQNKKNNKLEIYQINKLEEIDGWYWKHNYDNIWMKNYDLLIKYIIEKKEIPFSKLTVFNNIKIGAWCQKQKDKYKNNCLSKDRREKLEKINGWYWENEYDKQWNDMYNLLLEYVRENNSIPIRSILYKEKNIGSWCGMQRMNYKQNKITQNRINNLEKIPEWYWEHNYDEEWNIKYIILKKFIAKYNRLPYPSDIYNKTKIGEWCTRQKTEFKNNNLSKYRIEKLEKIKEWYWKLNKNDMWEYKYELVKEFMENNNNKVPVKRCIYKEIRIGAWCNLQRTNKREYSKYKLSKERIEKLENIKGWYWNK